LSETVGNPQNIANSASLFFVFLRFLLILRTGAHAHTKKTPKTSNKTVRMHHFFDNTHIPWRISSNMPLRNDQSGWLDVLPQKNVAPPRELGRRRVDLTLEAEK
jgi:hypothetical protein